MELLPFQMSTEQREDIFMRAKKLGVKGVPYFVVVPKYANECGLKAALSVNKVDLE